MTDGFGPSLPDGIDTSDLARNELELDGEQVEELAHTERSLSFVHPQYFSTLQSNFDLTKHRIDGATLASIFQNVTLEDHVLGVTDTDGGIVTLQLQLLHDAIDFAAGDSLSGLDVMICTPSEEYPTVVGIKPLSQNMIDSFNATMNSMLSTESGVLVVLPPNSISKDAISGREKYDGLQILEVDSEPEVEPETEPDSTQDSEEMPTLTLSRIAAWGGAIISALALFNLQSPGNEVYLLMVAMAVSGPSTRPWIERFLGYKLSRGMVTAIVLLLWWVAGMMII